MITVFKTNKDDIYAKNSNKLQLNSKSVYKIFLFILKDKSENNYFQFRILGYDDLNLESQRKEKNLPSPEENDILCNPLYDIDSNGMKVLITTLQNNFFKSVSDYKSNKFSKGISFNRYNHHHHRNFLTLIPSKLLKEIGCKCNFFNLIKKFNMNDHHPKTFYDNELPEDAKEKNYFLKYTLANAQRGVYFGKKDFLDKVLTRWPKSQYIYQEPIYNCLNYAKDRRIIFGMWFLLFDDSFMIYKKTTEISVDTLKPNGKMSLCYNLLRDEDIPNHKIILNNMIQVCEKFLQNFQKHLKECNYSIRKNELGLCRMDFLIETETNKPIMLEINTGIDLDGKESFKDTPFCEFLVKEKFINLLQNDFF